jgi:hypothetical protein
VRLRHKIEKASAAKQRKNRKIAKTVCIYIPPLMGLLNICANQRHVLESGMAVTAQKGSRDTQSLSLQRQDTPRDRREEEAERGGNNTKAGRV